jgi:hypothetical protein
LTALGVLSSLAAALLVTVGSWQGCSIYGPDLLLPAASCARATFPLRPASDDPSATPNSALVAAMQSLDVGVGVSTVDGSVVVGPIPTGSLPPLGWDLDNACTCPGAPSCQQAQGTKENCDDDAGRDHTGLELFRKLGPTAQMSNAAANEALQTGQYGLLVQMTGYNGTPNDTRVTVALYFSSGVLGTGDAGMTQLAHDGTDRWTVDPRSIVGGPELDGSIDCDKSNAQCQPNYVDDNAYVADNVLVASLSDVPITFGGRANLGGAVMELSQTILVGTLRPVALFPSGNSWAIDNGSVSGRWGSKNLLSNMATIPDPTSDGGAYLCGQDVAYQLLKNYICSLQDIASNSTQDNLGAPCDAISMSFGFTAEPAQLGVTAPLPATPQGCNAGGVPFHDLCPQ